jgi:hypothetical protein
MRTWCHLEPASAGDDVGLEPIASSIIVKSSEPWPEIVVPQRPEIVSLLDAGDQPWLGPFPCPQKGPRQRKGTTMNDYTLRLLAIDRTSAFQREADRDRLAAQVKRTDRGASGKQTASAQRVGIRDIVRRLSLRPL